MACAVGSSGRGPFGRSAFYESPFPCHSGAYGPYQEWPSGGYAEQRRNPYAQMYGSRQSSFGGMGYPDFSSFAQSDPYARWRGYQDFGTGMGMPMGSGMGSGGRGHSFSQSPFIGLQSPRGFGIGSDYGREHVFSHSNYRRRQATRRGQHRPSRFSEFDDETDSEEDFSPSPQYRPQRPRRGGLFGNNMRHSYGMCPMPRQYGRYNAFDNYDDEDDEDDFYDDYFTHPSWRRQRYY